jgi:hypothetical protein
MRLITKMMKTVEFRSIFDNASLGIALVDQRAPIQSNYALRHLVGGKKSIECLIASLFRRGESSQTPKTALSRTRLDALEPYTLTTQIAASNGRPVMARIAVSPVRHKRLRDHFVVVAVQELENAETPQLNSLARPTPEMEQSEESRPLAPSTVPAYMSAHEETSINC